MDYIWLLIAPGLPYHTCLIPSCAFAIRGRLCFIPKAVYPRLDLPEGAHGWRAFVAGVTAKGFLITCVGEEGTRDAKCKFTKAKCLKEHVVPLTE